MQALAFFSLKTLVLVFTNGNLIAQLSRKAAYFMIRSALDGLYLLAGYLAGFFLLVIFMLMMALSLGREFGLNIPAGDDFAAWSMAAMAFLGLAHTFKSGDLIRVGLVLERWSAGMRRIVEIVCLLIGTAVIGFFAWHAVFMTYDSWRFNDISQGVVAVPLWFPQLGYSVGLVILAIAFLDELIHVLTGHTPRYEKPPAATPEEIVERAAESGI
ncbi:TRAP-type C4-dicarboxylate transport system, small permease component [Microvirga guangxiensis]|uniref:TRAP transporter small permease protein n=2 Tax=Microvirga guangxiensis TaxID=549386 RepID=A0A1G5GCI5_9HYPH|nr:TRAP-type C4-dicarboxylate transport system, small permease component [Microvirga guangxiensis]